MNTLDKDDDDKRQVPAALQKLLQLDVQFTKGFLNTALKVTALRSLRNHAKLLEWSCHGIVWLASWLAFIWVMSRPSLYQVQVNMLIALILDIVVIAFTKAFVRRRRPAASAKTSFLGPDKYSFPSGHPSRAVLIAFIFIYLEPLPFILIPPLLAWVVAISLSRVLVERHYILDVVGGIVIGLLEGLFMTIIWFSQSTSMGILQMLSDEKLDGGEYHV